MKIKAVFRVIESAVWEFVNDGAMNLASSLAFYTVLSLAPLLVIAVWVVSLFFRGDAQEEAVQRATDTIGPQAAEIVRTVLHNATDTRRSTIAAIIGFGTFLFSASGVFGQLQYSLNRIWNVKSRSDAAWWDWFRKRFWSLVMMLLIGTIFLASIVAGTVLAAVQSHTDQLLKAPWFWSTINQVLPLCTYVVMFALIYKILPDVNMKWSDVWLGSFITAILFTVGRYFIGIYLGKSTTSSVYGAAGSLAVLLLWLYYSAVIFFFGAELTQALARALGHHIGPSRHAEWIDPQDASVPH